LNTHAGYCECKKKDQSSVVNTVGSAQFNIVFHIFMSLIWFKIGGKPADTSFIVEIEKNKHGMRNVMIVAQEPRYASTTSQSS
jgi:hypothetical protein